MSFTQETFATVGAQSTDTPTVYSYKTEDSAAVISTTGYFSEKSNELVEGDLIFAQAADGFVFFEVLSETSSVKITFQAIANRVIINTSDDFPDAVDGKIPLVASTEYYIGSNPVSVSDGFTLAPNVTINGANAASALTYTGAGAMFEGANLGLVTIKNLALDAPAGTIFDITDTVQGTVVNLLDYRITSCVGLGQCTDILAFVMEFGTIFDMDQGIALNGSIAVISIEKLFGFSTSASFIAVDLGSSVAPTIEFANMALSAPSGAIGISGLTSSGNVASGSIAHVSSCEFLGGMTALQNITVDDVRWAFQSNSGINDTAPDALGSLVGNTAQTSIGVADTPVKVNTGASMTSERSSHFTVGADGRITYIGEKDISVPIDALIGMKSVSGNPDGAIFIAINGVVVTPKIPFILSSTKPKQAMDIWQHNFVNGDYVEIFVSNVTSTANLIVESAILRVR